MLTVLLLSQAFLYTWCLQYCCFLRRFYIPGAYNIAAFSNAFIHLVVTIMLLSQTPYTPGGYNNAVFSDVFIHLMVTILLLSQTFFFYIHLVVIILNIAAFSTPCLFSVATDVSTFVPEKQRKQQAVHVKK